MQIGNLEAIAMDLRNVPGDCAEFGCYEGESTIHIAKVFHPRRVWAWDTFSGMPDDGYIERLDQGNPPGKWTPGNNPLVAFAKTKMEIIPVVGKYSFTIPRWIEDMVCPTCGHKEPVKFAFVHVDCDHYDAYRRVLEFITPRMSPGGLVRFDDLDCPGAKQAIEEYIARTGRQRNNEWMRF